MNERNETNERKYANTRGVESSNTKKTACNAKRNVKNYKNKKQSKVGARKTQHFPGDKECERGRRGKRELQRVSATFCGEEVGGGASRFKNDNGNFVNCLKD